LSAASSAARAACRGPVDLHPARVDGGRSSAEHAQKRSNGADADEGRGSGPVVGGIDRHAAGDEQEDPASDQKTALCRSEQVRFEAEVARHTRIMAVLTASSGR
jgi:hypothetical protein